MSAQSCKPIGERTFCGADIDRHYLEDNNEWTCPVLNAAGQYVHPDDTTPTREAPRCPRI